MPCLVAMAVLVMPWILTYSRPPSSTFFNQIAAWAGLALLVWAMASRGVRPARVTTAPAVAPLLGALVLIAAACLWSTALGSLPPSLGLASAATLAGVAVATLSAAVFAARGSLQLALACLLAPIVVAASLNAGIAFVQVYAPGWPGSDWVQASAQPGRASGNLRQPNHLSSLALWAIVALTWFAESGRLRRRIAWPLMVLMVATIMTTGSRTGILGLLLVAVWGMGDRGLSRGGRWMLALLPLAYALVRWLNEIWSAASNPTGTGVVGAMRIDGKADISSARFSIWSDTLELIAQHPWFGVGYGEFNFAWSLNPFPGRSFLLFDHAHNLPLHLLAELGLPLGAAVIGLLLLSLWWAFQAARHAPAPENALALRVAFMLVLLMALHSMLEYPLWYSYFLLPTAFALGLCLGGRALRNAPVDTGNGRQPDSALARHWPKLGAAALLAGSLYAVADYWRVVVIFSPGEGATRTLAERIEAGKRSLFFAHHAHYAAATTAVHPSEVMDSFKIASHFLLDTRLMLAWAQAYAEAGDVERARYLADRLREFRNDGSRAFFDACLQAPLPGGTRPFQCEPARLPMDERAFR